MDTPNISSSPEHQLSHPFAIPTKAAPVQKHYGSSSEGSSSENAKETSPKRKKWMQAIKGKDSENSESSGDSQGPFSHPHSTPVELSSREVTHLDPPGLRSTPTEMSFECLQLSGECHKLTTSVYSMPDALSASPSTEVMPGPNQIYHLSESAKADKKEPDVKDKRESVCTLPKWLENEIEKRIDFDNARLMVFTWNQSLFIVIWKCHRDYLHVCYTSELQHKNPLIPFVAIQLCVILVIEYVEGIVH